jgi:hypothetical protein
MPAASAIRTALAGYRWGIERKRELIRKDAMASAVTSGEA